MRFDEAMEHGQPYADREDRLFYVVAQYGYYDLVTSKRVTVIRPTVQDQQVHRFLRKLTDDLHKCGIEATELDEWLRDIQRLAVVTPKNVKGNIEVLMKKCAEILYVLENN